MLGTVTIFLTSGFLCQTLGWPSVFYIFGELVLLEPRDVVFALGCRARFLGLAPSVAHQSPTRVGRYVTTAGHVPT